MGLFRIVAYVIEIAALGVIIGLSLTTVVIMALLKSDYNGACPLYATANARFIYFHQPSNCNYVIGIHSVALIFSIAAGAYKVMELIKQKQLIKSTYVPFTFIVAYLLFAVLIMVSACIVTVGFNKLCKELVKNSRHVSCVAYQRDQDNLGYDPSHFHDYLVSAETTAWLSFGMFLGVAGLTFLTSTCFKNKM